MMNLLAKLKNLFAGIAIVALLAAPFMPLTAQADTPTSATDVNYYGTDVNGTPLNPADQAQNFGNLNSNLSASTPSPVNANGQVTNNPPAAKTQTIDDTGCWQAGGTWGNSVATCLANVVYTFTVGIGTGFAYVSAYFFDWAVSLSLNSLAYSQQFVSQGWTTARDIANMAFLFIILYTAFIIMLQADTNGTLQTLLHVIVIALLINFSFFGVRLIIDAGNIVAIQFYNAINVQSVATTASGAGVVSGSVLSTLNTVGGAVGSSVGGGNTKDLTQGIMGMLNLQGLFSVPSFQAFQNTHPSPLVTFITLSFLYIAAGIMFWILSITFAVAGVKFIVRVVTLWFLIIASPLALVAYAFSGGGGAFKKWLDTLISETFYPVVFLFVFLMLTIFANQMGQTNGLINGIFNGLQGANGQNGIAQIGLAAANVGIRLGLVVAVLWAGLKFANEFKTLGSKAAGSFGNWTGRMYAAGFGRLGGGLLRNTVGIGGHTLAASSELREMAASTGLRGLVGRGVWRSADSLSHQSFDIRGGLNAVGIDRKDIGKPSGQGGFTAAFDTRVKAREEFAKNLKPSERKIDEAYQEEISKLSDQQRKEMAQASNALEAARKNKDDIGDEESKKDFKEKQKEFNRLAKPVIDRAKKAAGVDNDKTYADTITTEGRHNLGMIFASDKEAAAKIRGNKNDEGRLKNVLKNLNIKPDDDEPPTTPSGGGGAPAPRSSPSSAPPPSSSQNVVVGPWPGSSPAQNSSHSGWGIFSRSGGMSTIDKERLALMREQLKEERRQTKILQGGLANIQTSVAHQNINAAELGKSIGAQISKNSANDNFHAPPAQQPHQTTPPIAQNNEPLSREVSDTEKKAA